ncbi:zinc-dependent metalloprotease family protein [Pseudomonas sp. NPDC088368]|jgi:hypothetical protein|uniref:zinc-dependent metalloprotease family protein n=1 Tax=Pseudomonas sp. NPDC088368 TaxID=3364453 RepID=UPI00380A3E8A
MKVISTLMAILVITLAALFLRNLTGEPFLGTAPESVQGDEAFQAALNTLRAFPATQSVQEVSVDPHAITLNQKMLKLSLIDHPITATKVRSEEVTNPDGSQSILWFGNLEPHASVQPEIPQWQDPLNFITLVKSGQTITGTIRQGSQLFEIRPVGPDRHVVVVLDSTKMPPELDNIEHGKSASDQKPGHTPRSLTPTADPTLTTFDVMTVVPQKTVSDYQGDMVALVQLAVALANQSYINSRIGIKLRLVAYQATSYAPNAALPGLDLVRLQNPKDGYMDDAITLRNETRADIVVYLYHASAAGDGSLSCGQALQNGSAADTAFAMVNYECIANLTFTHEVERLQSLR